MEGPCMRHRELITDQQPYLVRIHVWGNRKGWTLGQSLTYINQIWRDTGVSFTACRNKNLHGGSCCVAIICALRIFFHYN